MGPNNAPSIGGAGTRLSAIAGGVLCHVRLWCKAKSADAAINIIRRINILEKLPLVLKHACVFKPGAVVQFSNRLGEDSGPASVQTAQEYILHLVHPVTGRYAGSAGNRCRRRRSETP